jgi:hypothetical protein
MASQDSNIHCVAPDFIMIRFIAPEFLNQANARPN